jgi:hypothetical protein
VVKVENIDLIGILVRDEYGIARRIKYEVSWNLPQCWRDLYGRHCAFEIIDAEYRDAIVSAVRSVKKPA